MQQIAIDFMPGARRFDPDTSKQAAHQARDEEKGAFRSNDPDTSKEAGQSINAAALERIVLTVVKRFPDGCIAEQVYRELPQFEMVSISPRFAPLLRKGFIVDTGNRKPSSSGRSQRVVRAV